MNHVTESGIPDLGKIPWGAHICQMYATPDELAQSLIPYFMAGLASNERCIWITSEPYNAQRATDDLKKLLPELKRIIDDGRLKICDYVEWYLNTGSLNSKITEQWLDEEQRSLSEGYEGLRIAGNTSFVTPVAWDAFMEYEREIEKRLFGRRIVALCSYDVANIAPTNFFDVVRSHNFSIHRSGGGWEVLTDTTA